MGWSIGLRFFNQSLLYRIVIKSYRGIANGQNSIFEIVRPERQNYLDLQFGTWNHLVVNMPGIDPNVVTAIVPAIPDIYLNNQLLSGSVRTMLLNEDNWPYGIILGANFNLNTTQARLSLDEFLLFNRLMTAYDVASLYEGKWPCHGMCWCDAVSSLK